MPIVGLEPSCTAVLRVRGRSNWSATQAAAAGGRHPHAGRTAGRAAAGNRRGWTDGEVIAQPHCHHHAVMSWDRTPSCCAAPAPSCPGWAAAAGWQAISVSSEATTRCRSPWPSSVATRRSARRRPATDPGRRLLVPDPARRPGPAPASIWPSCWPAGCPGPGRASPASGPAPGVHAPPERPRHHLVRAAQGAWRRHLVRSGHEPAGACQPRAPAPGAGSDRSGVRASARRPDDGPARAHVAGALLAAVPGGLRRDAVQLPDDPPDRAGDGAAARGA